MGFLLLIETIVHLKPKQLLYQVLSRIHRNRLVMIVAPSINHKISIVRPIAKEHCCEGSFFSFLNISDQFLCWNQIEHGMLWAYNLNYMDWLGQKDITITECECWIEKFIAGLPHNKVGLDPYPIALRTVNWIKFFSLQPKTQTQRWNDILYSQVKLLENRLEYWLLGNHLLEDAYALFMASIYFCEKRLYHKASKLLQEQLTEQVLPDGAHYEQSPMYHCILLDRLLDCYNFSNNNDLFEDQYCITSFLKRKAELMLGHLMAVIYKDGSIPLLNDAVMGIAPPAQMIFDYASRLGLKWNLIPMKECGYRKLEYHGLEAIVDVGNITASYQPGHSHADALNFELRIDGNPFIVDTGISTYDKTPRRQYERSTVAHNTVVVNGKDSSRVWGGFRVGKRCKVRLVKDCSSEIIAWHDGFKKKCERKFTMIDDAFRVEDYYDGNAVSYIHLAPNADIKRIRINGAVKIEIIDNHYSVEYNRFILCKVMKIHFRNSFSFTIQ